MPTGDVVRSIEAGYAITRYLLRRKVAEEVRGRRAADTMEPKFGDTVEPY